MILCLIIICGFLIANNNSIQEKTDNNSEIRINITNNSTNNANSSASTKESTKTSKKSNNKKDSNTIGGEKIQVHHDIDENTEYIGTKNNVYFKNKKTGKTYKRKLKPGSGVYDYVQV